MRRPIALALSLALLGGCTSFDFGDARARCAGSGKPFGLYATCLHGLAQWQIEREASPSPQIQQQYLRDIAALYDLNRSGRLSDAEAYEALGRLEEDLAERTAEHNRRVGVIAVGGLAVGLAGGAAIATAVASGAAGTATPAAGALALGGAALR